MASIVPLFISVIQNIMDFALISGIFCYFNMSVYTTLISGMSEMHLIGAESPLFIWATSRIIIDSALVSGIFGYSYLSLFTTLFSSMLETHLIGVESVIIYFSAPELIFHWSWEFLLFL